MKNITIKDIANKIGVTPSTVSRALAGNVRVSEKTRKLVCLTAKEMGYRHNVMASSLRKGRSGTVGMIVPRVNRTFFSNVISGVEEILNSAGISLVICQSNENLHKEKKAIETLLLNRVDGILISLSVQSSDHSHLGSIIELGIPLIMYDRVSYDYDCVRVVNDNFNGAYLATKHLIKNGYKRIGHFGGSKNLKVYIDRYEGYKYALKEAGIKLNEDYVYFDVITKDAGSEFIIDAFYNKKCDAMFCSGDFSALGAYTTLINKGVDIPREFGIVGFGNEPLSGLLNPGLSSVEQNAKELGNKAAKLLLNKLSDNNFVDDVIVPTCFIARESSNKLINKNN